MIAKEATDMALSSRVVVPLFPPDRAVMTSMLEELRDRVTRVEMKLDASVILAAERDRKLDQIIHSQQAQDNEARARRIVLRWSAIVGGVALTVVGWIAGPVIGAWVKARLGW